MLLEVFKGIFTFHGRSPQMRKVALLVFLAVFALASTMPAQTVTEENLLAVSKKSPDLAIKAISMAKKIEVDLSFENLPVLLEKGVPQSVLDALVQRKERLESKTSTGSNTTLQPVLQSHPPAAAESLAVTHIDGYPDEVGVYYHSVHAIGKWVRIEGQSLNFGVGGIGKTAIFSKIPFAGPGVKNKYTYPGKEALVKVPDLNPEFLIRESALSANEVVVAKLKIEKSERTLQFGGINRFGIPQFGGPKKENFVEAKVERVAPDLFIVRFSEKLDDGEYAIGLRGDMPRYDFSVRSVEVAQN